MIVERTFDTGLVRSIFSSRRLKLRITDATVEDFDPENQKNLYYLSCIRDGVVVGIVLFHPFNTMACCQGHINYLQEHWGSNLEECTKKAITWMFENTGFIKIVALIPDYYPLVLKHAIASGMRKEGYIENSVICNGKVGNMTLVGIDKCT
jgi:RimJ/RimL family protein N-acetyltransferase